MTGYVPPVWAAKDRLDHVKLNAMSQGIADMTLNGGDPAISTVLQDPASESYAAVESTIDAHLGGDATGLVTTVAGKIGYSGLGMISVAAHGATGDGTSDNAAALTDADMAARTTGGVLSVSGGVFRVSSDLTINSAVSLSGTAKIKPDAGVTVILAGGVDAPQQQVFDHSAGGIVAPRNVPFYHPAWWGGVGEDDDSQTWKDMADALSASATTVEAWLSVTQRVMAPTGVNRIVGVTLSHCEIFADKGTTYITAPEGTTAGTVLTLGDYTTLHGGYFEATDGQSVTLLDVMGKRCQVVNPYVSVRASNATGIVLGVGAGATTSPRLKSAQIYGDNSGVPVAGTTGLVNNSSDGSIIDLWIGYLDIGVNWQISDGTSATDVHVFNCNTGHTGSPDNVRGTSWYLDRNRGWGMDWSGSDGCIIESVFASGNGAQIAGTGGMRFTKPSGSAEGCRITGILDDNVGTGLVLDGVSGYDVSMTIISSSVRGGGQPVCTTGVQVTSATDSTGMRLNGLQSAVQGALLDNSSANSSAIFADHTFTLAADATWTNTTANQSLWAIPAAGDQTWTVSGCLIVDGDQATDLKARLQADGLTPSGWFALNGVSTSATSATSDQLLPSNVVPVSSSAGLYSTSGTVGVGNLMAVQFSGSVATGAASGNSRLQVQVSPLAASATTTTVHAGSWIRFTRIS